jgi:hypothetical protein
MNSRFGGTLPFVSTVELDGVCDKQCRLCWTEVIPQNLAASAEESEQGLGDLSHFSGREVVG